MSSPPSLAAGSCVFSPQHYRPRVCRVCFMAESEHAATAQKPADPPTPPQPAPSQAAARPRWTRPPEQKSFQQMREEAMSEPPPAAASVAASAPPAAHNAPSSTASSPERRRWPEQLSPPAPAAATTTAAQPTTQQPAAPHDASSTDQSLPASAAVAAPPQSEESAEVQPRQQNDETPDTEQRDEEPDEDQEDDENPADELADAVRDDGGVPQAPTFDGPSPQSPLPADGPLPFNRRSQSVSVGSSSSAAASSAASAASSSSPGGDRASLLSAIQSAPRLRRSSEQHPRPARKPVVDLNSELTWAISRKKKLDPALRDAGEAIKTLPDLARHQLLEIIGRVLRVDSAGPAPLPNLMQLLADRDAFVATYASKLGASASSLEAVESTWPATKIDLMASLRSILDRHDNCVQSVRRYTRPFETYKARMQQQATGEAAASSSAASASSAAAPGLSFPAVLPAAAASLSEDWAIVDSLILQRSLQSLLSCVDELRKLQRDADGILNAELDPVYVESAETASALVDLCFERCEIIYAPSAAATAAVAGAAAAPSPAVASLAVPAFSQTSKSVRNFQTLDLALQAFKMLSQPSSMGFPALVSNWSENQLAAQAQLAALKKSIEASPEYKAHIAVSQRRGKWDEREVVQLRSTNRAQPANAEASRKSNGHASGSGSGDASGTAALSSAAADRIIAELKADHPELIALLQRKLASTLSCSKPNNKDDATAAMSASASASAAAAPAPAPASSQGSLDEDDSSSSASNASHSSELSALLRPLASVPLVAVCQLLLQLVIPARDADSFRVFVAELLLPRLQSAIRESPQAHAEWTMCAAQLMHACVAANFIDGVRMCVQRISPLAPNELDSPPPTLGLDANLRSALSGGNTPLHVAAAALHLELCCVLIEEGANPLAINTFERTPLFSLRQLFASESKASAAAAALVAGSASAVAASSAAAHGSSLFARYLKSPRLSDVTLRLEICAAGSGGAAGEGEVVDVVSIPAHRIVLCAQSEVLRVMLGDEDAQAGAARPSGVWAEAAQFASANAASASSTSSNGGSGGGLDDDDSVSSLPRGPPVVTLPAIPSLSSFDLLLRWLYTGSCLFVNDDLSLPAALLSMATRFMMEPLRQAMQMHLSAPQRMLPSNVDSLYNLALHCEARELQRRIEHFVCERYADLVAARPSLAQRTPAGIDGAPASSPHAFLVRVLRGLRVGEMGSRTQQNQAKHTRWKP